MTTPFEDVAAVRSIMSRLEVHSRSHHRRNIHDKPWIMCTIAICVGDKDVLGERYLEERM